MKKGLSYINGNRRKEYMQDYYRRNRERINARVTEYCKNHDEERRIRRKERYESHRELQIRRVRANQKIRKLKLGHVNRIDRRIDACPTERSKQKLLRKRARIMELRKICSQRRNDRKIQKRKEEREAKVQAAIEAWKNELT
jgi:hypothetical protein